MPCLSRLPIRLYNSVPSLRLAPFAPVYRQLISAAPRVARLLSTFTTMAPKRKKSNMALLQEDLKTSDQLSPENALSASVLPRRRSGRNVNKTGMYSYPENSYSESDVQDKENPNSKSTSSSNGQQRKPKPEKKSEGRAVIDAAMKDLHQMEDDLRQNTKRQKMAAKNSSISEKICPQSLHAAAFDPVTQMDQGLLGNDATTNEVTAKQKQKKGDTKIVEMAQDAAVGEGEEMDGESIEAEDVNLLKTEGARPPPVNSDYLPLPWKGRLGYACLNTYLRLSNPPVFSSRTCRIASIIEHRHPLKDPSQPEHATKNRPDKDQPADIARGQKYVEELGLANARDIVKMLRWNDKYNIKFMRLSSEMFPFASHDTYGYKLAPFASEVLAEAGRVAGQLGHRLTTHPGQFTQLGSPRKEVVTNAIRDLEYHDEMLTLLKLPEQQNKDAVMILHMGGVFGDKEATLQRFRENYAKLSDSIKARLVLENDDVCYTVHDLLPICEELNIPMVLDFHHHNILFDKDKIREGTKDITDLYPRIKATWVRKGITQKMHYSEPCPGAITGRQRRKHRPRVIVLPPCAPDMDLMIEAKDKEQAVFELMRTYKLPGWDTFNDVVPYERDDENKPPPKPRATPKKKRKGKKGTDNDDDVEMAEPEPQAPPEIPAEEVGMGGPNNRVYWPVGMEEWLRPKKREVKKKPTKAEEKGALKKEEYEDDS